MKKIILVCLGLSLILMGDQRAGDAKDGRSAPKADQKKADPPRGPMGPGGGNAPPMRGGGGGFLPGGPPAGGFAGGGFMPPLGPRGPQGGPPMGFGGGGPMGPPQGFPPAQQKRPALPKELVPALIEALKDDEKSVRQYAASALVRVGKDAVEPLRDLLKGKDKAQRANAAYVLGQMGPLAHDALPLLLKALKDDNKELRIRAAFAIDRLVKSNRESNPGFGMGMGMVGMGGGFMAGQNQQPAVVLPPDPGTVPPAPRSKPEDSPKDKDKKSGKDANKDKER